MVENKGLEDVGNKTDKFPERKLRVQRRATRELQLSMTDCIKQHRQKYIQDWILR